MSSPVIETPQGSVRVQDAQETYREMREKMESAFQNLRQGSGDQSSLDALQPSLEEFLGYVRTNPTSLALLTNVEEYDDVTFNHGINVCIYAILYGHHQGFTDDHLFDLAFSALLHDVGKTQLPIDLVQKKGELTEHEYDQMKKHPRHGRDLLREYGPTPSASIIAYQHHERPDGSGYPQGREELDANALIISVVDVYEALTAPRPYRSPLVPAQAFLVMKDEFHSDPVTRKIRNNLIRCMGLFSLGSFVQLSNGMIGVVEKNHAKDLASPVVRVVINEENEPVDSPFSLDLHKVKQQKVMKNDRMFDHSIEIKKAISLEAFPDLKPKIRNLIQDETLTLESE